MRIHARLLSLLVFLLLGLVVGGIASASESTQPATLDPALATRIATLAADEPVAVIVILRDQADLKPIREPNYRRQQQSVVVTLRQKADATQARLRSFLDTRRTQGGVAAYSPLWIFNAIAVTGTRQTILDLLQQPEVARIAPDDTIPAPRPSPQATPQAAATNITLINAPAVWNTGDTGQNVTVAIFDTGVDNTHPDLAAGWRGGTNSWYDPYDQHSTPADSNGHGTQTAGVIVGRNGSGTDIGVAPGATWIAAKIFNDSNTAVTSAIHSAFQWALDPDNNPATADAPRIINNSWDVGNPGCDLRFAPDLASINTAGIAAVFAAGNFGVGSSGTDVSPANNPNAYSVGAANNSDQIAAFSSRGPTFCGTDYSRPYPDLSAPGVAIGTTDRFGGYSSASGTSLAAPHTTGGMALLLSAFPNLTPSQLAIALSTSAHDLGDTGTDNTYGAGRLDVLAAYNAASAGTLPTPTATPNTGLIFTDGFESGDTSRWSKAIGTNVGVSASAVLDGAKGMQIGVAGNTPGYVVKTLASPETAFYAHFAFNPNGTKTGTRPHTLLAAHTATGQAVFVVQYRLKGKATFQVRAGVTVGKKTARYGSWYTIPNAATTLNIGWQSAKSANFTFSIGGTLKQTLARVNTAAFAVSDVWLGVSGRLDKHSVGTPFFDAFVARRFIKSGP